MKLFLALVFTLLCVGCASPYKPPTTIAPDEWNGVAGYGYKFDTITTKDDEILIGEVAITGELILTRTAELLEDIQITSAFGGSVQFLKGTSLWGIQYSVLKSEYGKSHLENVQVENNPIEWCMLSEEASLFSDSSELYCVFWEDIDRARYIRGYHNRSHIPKSVSKNGMIGPVPNIQEKPINLNETFYSSMKVDQINKIGVRFIEFISNERGLIGKKKHYLKWSEGSDFLKDGVNVTVKPLDDFKSVLITVKRSKK